MYLPFQTLSMLFSDLHYNYASFNGTTVYVNDDNRYPAMHRRDPAFSDPILDADERASDLAEFGYAHLCLAIDYLYGRPGVHFAYGEELDEVGLDGLLESLGETGVAIRDALRSRDLARYMVGLDALCALMDDGGHTYIDALYFTDLMDNEGRQELLERYMACRDDARDPLGAFVREAMERLPRNYDQSLAFDKLHDDAFGDERYVVEGDTALIVLDSFNGIDYEGWEDYYAGRGERPSATEPYDDSGMIDSAAIVLDGLERAAADPSVRNVVLDVSNNGGGSLDVVALVCAIMTGDASLRFENTLMGTVEREEFDVDVNLDGSFDERDGEPAYPGLTFAVLTGPGSFSCGNIAPARLKDEGILARCRAGRRGAWTRPTVTSTAGSSRTSIWSSASGQGPRPSSWSGAWSRTCRTTRPSSTCRFSARSWTSGTGHARSTRRHRPRQDAAPPTVRADESGASRLCGRPPSWDPWNLGYLERSRPRPPMRGGRPGASGLRPAAFWPRPAWRGPRPSCR